jgi:glyoxylase-like metal-dependent hydrolase (beta-lactamase superfamily II)
LGRQRQNLTTIYITHAHGDHFLGLKFLLDRLPNAERLPPSVVAAMQNQIKPEFISSFWEPRFPGQVHRSWQCRMSLKDSLSLRKN